MSIFKPNILPNPKLSYRFLNIPLKTSIRKFSRISWSHSMALYGAGALHPKPRKTSAASACQVCHLKRKYLQ